MITMPRTNKPVLESRIKKSRDKLFHQKLRKGKHFALLEFAADELHSKGKPVAVFAERQRNSGHAGEVGLYGENIFEVHFNGIGRVLPEFKSGAGSGGQ